MRDTLASKMDYLYPDFAVKVVSIINHMEEKGFQIKMTSTLRSISEQEKLFQIGRTPDSKEKVVTNTKFSYHNLGLAVDFCQNLKTEAYPKKDSPFWIELGAKAEDLGLTWGGRFSMQDLPHVQYKLPVSLDMLEARFKMGGICQAWQYVDELTETQRGRGWIYKLAKIEAYLKG